jgi:hypothetical protein
MPSWPLVFCDQQSHLHQLIFIRNPYDAAAELREPIFIESTTNDTGTDAAR